MCVRRYVHSASVELVSVQIIPNVWSGIGNKIRSRKVNHSIAHDTTRHDTYTNEGHSESGVWQQERVAHNGAGRGSARRPIEISKSDSARTRTIDHSQHDDRDDNESKPELFIVRTSASLFASKLINRENSRHPAYACSSTYARARQKDRPTNGIRTSSRSCMNMLTLQFCAHQPATGPPAMSR